jgi:SPP1 family predicted phage head-tail adaptor
MKYNKNEVTGKMRDRIILQNVNRSRSLTGFASESWADIATIWAFAESKLPGSNETIIEGKNTAKNICDFTIRYNQSITEESRVIWGDKLYQVKNLKVSHDRRFISFQGVFYDSYILTGVNVAASVNGIATTSANLKLIMSVIGQANAIASTFGELTVFQQGVIEVAASVNALGNASANLTKVISISGDLAGSAFVDANVSIVQNISASVQTDANVSADLKLIKTLESSVTGTATATSILDVVTQGIVSLDASVTAMGEITANLLRIATLASSPTTAADTSAIATLTKVLEATATATAETDASAQLTIPVNASATATAETSADAQLSYTVNAEATSTAETSAEAQIVRIISASATATAESSAEASFGVTFAASVEGTANVDNATIARAATMAASVSGNATVTGATLTTVDNVAASVSGTATVTNATLTVTTVVVYDTDAQAFFDRVTTAGGTLTTTEKNSVNTLVLSMKSNGTWAKMSAIYPMVGASAAACRQNLKSASFTGSFTAGWTFASTGATPNGTSAYMDTSLIPNVNLNLNNTHISTYIRTTIINSEVEIGSFSNLYITNYGYGAVNGGDIVVTNTSGQNGFFINSRITSSQIKQFKNSTLLGTYSDNSTVLSNYSLYLCAFNNNGVASQYSKNQTAFVSIGNGLTDTEATNLNTVVQAFQTSLSRQV